MSVAPRGPYLIGRNTVSSLTSLCLLEVVSQKGKQKASAMSKPSLECKQFQNLLRELGYAFLTAYYFLSLLPPLLWEGSVMSISTISALRKHI